MKLKADFFFRNFDDIKNRLDENYNNPKYIEITKLLAKSNYDVTDLGDTRYLKRIVSGKTPKGIHYKEEGIPFLGAHSIINGKVLLDDSPKISKDIHNTVLRSSIISSGCVLISIAGTIGRCAVYDYNSESNANQAIAILNFDENEINPKFVSMYLNCKLGQLFFGKLQHVSSQPNINLEELKQIKIVLPDKKTQDSIMEKTAKIKSHAEKIESKIDNLKEGVSALVLTSINMNIEDNPSFFFKTGKEAACTFPIQFNEIENRIHILFYHPKMQLLEKLTKTYSVTKLQDIVKVPIRRGEQPKYTESGVTVIKTVNLKDEYIDYDNCLYVSDEFFKQYPNTHVEKGDILVSSTGLVSLGKIDVYDRNAPAMVDGHISIIRLKNGYDPYFVAYFLRSIFGKLQFERWCTGSSGQIELQPYDLEKFIIPDNSSNGIKVEKQKAIIDKIQNVLNDIKKLKSQNYKLLNKAFTLFHESLLNI